MPPSAHLPALCALSLLASGLAAQSTWVVDKLGQPGFTHLDLNLAIAASSPGDVILVRYVDPLLQRYSAAPITHALTLIGVGGQPGLTGNLFVENLPAGQTVTIRDFQLGPFPGNPPLSCGFVIRLNQGSVHVHNVDRSAVTGALTALNPWRIESNPSLVTLSYCSVDMIGPTGSLELKNTPQVTMHACVLQHAASATAPTLVVDGCELVLTDSTVIGSGIGLNGSAIEARNTSTVRIAGPATAVVTATGVSAVRGASSNQTVVVGNGAFVGPVVGVVLQQQSIAAFAGRIDGGNLLQMTMYGNPLGVGAFAVGAPLSGPVPLFGGSLWLDPLQSGFADLVAFDLTGRGTWQLQLPPMTGLVAWLQGVDVGIASTFRLTPPAVVIAP